MISASLHTPKAMPEAVETTAFGLFQLVSEWAGLRTSAISTNGFDTFAHAAFHLEKAGHVPVSFVCQHARQANSLFHFQIKPICRCFALPCYSTVCGFAPNLGLIWKRNYP